MHVRVIEGEARFRDARTVVLGPEEDVRFEIRARRFVIATGSQPVVPQISGIDAVPVFHQREHLRRTRAAEAPDRHRRRLERARARAGVPPARLRGDGAGDCGAAAGEGRPGMRRRRARRAGARGHHGPQRREGRARPRAPPARRGGAGRHHRGDHPGHRAADRDRPQAQHRGPRSRRRPRQARASTASRSTSASPPATGGSMRSATSPACRSSPTAPVTRPRS